MEKRETIYPKFIPADIRREEFTGVFYYVVVLEHKKRLTESGWVYDDLVAAEDFASYRANDRRYRNYSIYVEEHFEKPSDWDYDNLCWMNFKNKKED